MTIVFLILFVSALVCIVGTFYEVTTSKVTKCEHPNFAHYNSRKISECIDCAFQKPLEKSL